MMAPARLDVAPPTAEPRDLMTADETVIYLRLDADDRNGKERLRSLIRYQGLPRLKRGRLILFSRSQVLAWLAGKK